jgi:hypothetical protein
MYIITSKTRKRSPHGRQFYLEHHQADEVRIVDERTADKKLAKNEGWADPIPVPNQENSNPKNMVP